jgi:hypothetical protein
MGWQLQESSMYGMVNLAIEGLLTERYGQSVWQTVKDKAAPGIDCFLTMEQYLEEVTQGLVVAAAEITGRPMDEMLNELGEYFTGYVQRSGHGELLDIIGSNLPEALNILDNMHTRVALAFPDLRPPSFWCTDVDDHSLILHYLSERSGLASMIPGAVRGLGGLFNTEATVRQVASRGDGADHDQFLVTYNARSKG